MADNSAPAGYVMVPAEPVQEPVAWARQTDLSDTDDCLFVSRYEYPKTGYKIPLYAAPQPSDDAKDALVAALEAAATSLETISEKGGRDEYLDDMISVRGYANNRCRVAKEALAAYRAAMGVGDE